jgi:hypothetical protein
MLLIGSKALRLRGIDTGRPPLDVDVIATFDELGKLTRWMSARSRTVSIPLSVNKTVLKSVDGTIVEVEIAWPDTAAHSLLTEGSVWAPDVKDDWLMSANGFPHPFDVQVATLDQLYALKMSHRYLKNSPHFLKTMRDIQLMRSMGAKVVSADWLKRRELETYTYKHPKLNVMKKDFFTGDGVQYVFEHDDIHVAMAHFSGKCGDPVPAYTLYAKDGEQVKSDKVKFLSLSEDVRLYGVLEEAQVLALERSQIPFRGKVEARRSFDIALMKVCTSITSGWFREYAWENFDRVNLLYENDYVERFWRAVDDGHVRKIAEADRQDPVSNPQKLP